MAREPDVTKKKKKQRRPRYSTEFKKQAVQLALSGEDSISAVARDLGVHVKSLYDWVRVAKEHEQGGLNFDEKQELQHLRREVIKLRAQRDLLKKASMILGGAKD